MGHVLKFLTTEGFDGCKNELDHFRILLIPSRNSNLLKHYKGRFSFEDHGECSNSYMSVFHRIIKDTCKDRQKNVSMFVNDIVEGKDGHDTHGNSVTSNFSLDIGNENWYNGFVTNGSKSNQANFLILLISSSFELGQYVWDVFCGDLSSSRRTKLSKHFSRTGVGIKSLLSLFLLFLSLSYYPFFQCKCFFFRK